MLNVVIRQDSNNQKVHSFRANTVGDARLIAGRFMRSHEQGTKNLHARFFPLKDQTKL
jgi:hypothetical protein